MTAPTEQSGGLDANARGIVVLVVAVAVGFLLLWQGGAGGGGSSEVDAIAPTTTIDTSDVTDGTGTTTLPDAPDTTPTTEAPAESREPGEVTVLVLNGGLDVVGGAGDTSDTIGAAGYQMGAPANAADYPNVSTTAVYFQDGFEAEATTVAAVLGKDASIVQPMPDPPPGPGAESANVVVVLGADAPPPGETPEPTEPG